MQLKPRIGKEYDTIPFSIHKRIEGGATYDIIKPAITSFIFQYPQADRRGCNVSTPTDEPIEIDLSVSTSGSKGVQRREYRQALRDLPHFQYPQADRRGCNPNVIWTPTVNIPIFQYPQADRRGCNHIRDFMLRVRRLFFQYPQADRRGCN